MWSSSPWPHPSTAICRGGSSGGRAGGRERDEAACGCSSAGRLTRFNHTHRSVARASRSSPASPCAPLPSRTAGWLALVGLVLLQVSVATGGHIKRFRGKKKEF